MDVYGVTQKEIKMELPKKRYKSVLSMVWGVSDSLKFKLSFTWIIIKKRIKQFFKKKDK